MSFTEDGNNNTFDALFDGLDDEPESDDLHIEPEDSEMYTAEDDRDSRTIALGHIENFVLSFLTQLNASLPPPPTSDDDPMDTTTPSQYHPAARNRKPKKIEFQLADRRKIRPDGSFGTRKITYPKNSKEPSAIPVAQLFRVLELIHESLISDVPSTKRDIFYKDSSLFKTQAVVDRLVDDLAATFNLVRSDLNVRSSAKGLVCGSSLTIRLQEDETIYLNDSEGTLIPQGENIAQFDINGDISWVLIVEKDAIFQSLCQLKLAKHPSMPGRGIIITGKGYPDIATRQLVKSLSDNLPSSVPILALVDGDPHGIEILSVYKYGSMALKHESEKLAAGRVEWLGIWASELTSLDVDKDALIPISRHDEKKALSLLHRSSPRLPETWRKELMHLLHTRRKAEIEIITSSIQSPGHFHDLDLVSHSPGQEEPFLLSKPTSVSLLLRYLCDKISKFVASGPDSP